MPIRQDTLRRRWLASNNYATSTRQTYSQTLLDFERRYPVVGGFHGALPAEGRLTARSAVSTTRALPVLLWRPSRDAHTTGHPQEALVRIGLRLVGERDCRRFH